MLLQIGYEEQFMNPTITATDVRSRFNELMEHAKTSPVVITRYGKPEVVIISKQEYDRLAEAAWKSDEQKKTAHTQRTG
jgi:prevent-host-death family protein